MSAVVPPVQGRVGAEAPPVPWGVTAVAPATEPPIASAPAPGPAGPFAALLRLADRGAPVLAFVGVILAWELACRLVPIPPFVLPAPSAIARGFAEIGLVSWAGHAWATLRVVGFESAQRQYKAISNPGPTLLVQNLKIGGGANLFTHEQFADAKIYDADQPEFCGLRDYPILKSPNVAQVSVQGMGNQFSAQVAFSASLVCEILVDDNYGAHVPGAYARAGALVRQGGSFV